MFSFSTISNYHDALTAGKTTCTEAVEFYLQQIKAKQHLNAFTEVYEAEARKIATDLDTKRKAGNPTGKLHGVVIAIKDVLCYEAHVVTAASKILQGYKAVYTATSVQH